MKWCRWGKKSTVEMKYHIGSADKDAGKYQICIQRSNPDQSRKTMIMSDHLNNSRCGSCGMKIKMLSNPKSR